MALIAMAQAGDYDNPDTWVGGVVPADTDRITVGYDLRIPAGVGFILGDHTASSTAISIAEGVTLLIEGILYVDGDIIYRRLSTVSLNGGVVSQPKPYTIKRFDGASGMSNLISRIRDDDGMLTYPALYSTAGTGVSFFKLDSDVLFTKVDFEGLRISDYGSSSSNAFTYYGFVAGQDIELTNCCFLRCGRVQMDFGEGTGFVIDGLDIREPLTESSNIGLSISGVAVTGSEGRSLSKVTYHSHTTLGTFLINCPAIELVECVLYNCLFTTAGRSIGTKLTRCTIIATLVESGALVTVNATSASTISACVFLTQLSNPHYISEIAGDATSTTNIVTGCVFDGDDFFDVDAGDCVLPRGTITVEYSCAINKAGTLVSNLLASGRVTVNHCTMYKSYGIAVGETNGDDEQMVSFKNCLAISQEDGIHQQGAFVSQSAMVSDYNGFFDMTGAGNISHPTKSFVSGFAAETYNAWWTAGAYGDASKGANDVSVDPAFKSPNRTVRSFGSWEFLQGVADDFASINGVGSAGTTVEPYTKKADDVVSYIFAGLTPTEMSLASLGEGGSFIGAILPASESSARSIGLGFNELSL